MGTRLAKISIILALVVFSISSVFAGQKEDTRRLDRKTCLAKIEKFLSDEAIKQSIERDHYRDTDKIMGQVRQLSDEQLEELAAHTPDLVQLGGASGTQHVESRTAKEMSGDWMGFADKWLTVGVVIVGLMFLLTLAVI